MALANTNLTVNNVDIGTVLVSKDYLIEVYPYLVSNMKAAGLWVWGQNDYGEAGDGTSVAKSSPVQVAGTGANWKQVSSSGSTESKGAIKSDGTLWVWGNNNYGRLGNQSTVGTTVSSPITVTGGGSNWKYVSMGYHSAGIKTDGSLWTWGNNSVGQLGRSNVTMVSSPSQVGANTNWLYVEAKGWGAGAKTIAIKSDGTLWTWGLSSVTPSAANASSPVQNGTLTSWKQCSAGYYSVAAIRNDGTLWTWGYDNSGGLGSNGGGNRNSPQTTIAGGSNWKEIACGGIHTTAIKTDGTLWSWGNNDYGQVGDGTIVTRSSPVQIGLGTDWKKVSCSYGSSYALKTNGTIWSWGESTKGTLGIGDVARRSSPVQIGTGIDWKSIAATLAIKDGSAYPL
jgi:alpha-tubulin suppressor-like RCC1 family protein